MSNDDKTEAEWAAFVTAYRIWAAKQHPNAHPEMVQHMANSHWARAAGAMWRAARAKQAHEAVAQRCGMVCVNTGAPAWISVDERLPGLGAEVLIFPPPSEYILTGHCRDREGVTEWWYGDYERNFGRVEYGLGTEHVTHWMPLPADPEGVK